MTKDLISIIVPCFNVSKFLDDCFSSIENQTYKKYEVIFVNDGSTDDTLQKLETFCQKHPNCTIINQENQGVSAARNNALAVANGEFVCFVDADDLIAPDYIELLHTNITTFGSDWSVCAFKWVRENFSYKKVNKKHRIRKVKKFSSKDEILTQLLSAEIFHWGPVKKLYRMSILKNMETFPNVFDKQISYGEDADFNFRYAILIENVVYCPEKLYYYRQRKGSAVKSSFNEKHLSVFIGWQKNLEICKEKFPSVEKYVRACMCISCIEMLFRIYASSYKNPKVVKELFEGLKKNRKYLWQSKKFPLYKRGGIPIAPAFVRLLLWKKFH